MSKPLLHILAVSNCLSTVGNELMSSHRVFQQSMHRAFCIISPICCAGMAVFREYPGSIERPKIVGSF
ncbi:hypothetical protein GOODEAATRI_000825 [Goodea atripinnis]|uniref:Secreted protein n=1 Tax=Goodea atripinnis TaxID=208336 RepID=A0ABV0P0G0_9TELE